MPEIGLVLYRRRRRDRVGGRKIYTTYAGEAAPTR
jgi:hypothetical protein